MARKKNAPTLSVIVATQGRETLARMVQSCASAGVSDRDELIIVTDGFEIADPLALHMNILQMASGSGAGQIAYQELDSGHHCWGHCQINHGISLAKGQYIVLNDDDDAFTPGAFDRIRARVAELEKPAPLLYRFQAWYGQVFWDEPGIARENHIGGHCAVFPNDARLGRFTCRYQGDYDYIRSTLDNWGGDDAAVWVDDVIAIARPAEVAA